MPLEPVVVRGLRRELGWFIGTMQARRVLPVRLYVGTPGATSPTCRVAIAEGARLDPATDPGLAVDLVDRALDVLDCTVGACAWITRPEREGDDDADIRLLTAVRAGFGRHDLEPAAVVVLTRHRWHDLVSGEERRFVRIRVPAVT